MNIKEFRALTDAALQRAGLERRSLFQKGRAVWTLPGDDVIRFFSPQAYRRPWGFVYSGFVGIEISTLRNWLVSLEPKPDMGIFHFCFVGYVILNEDRFRKFMVENDEDVPAREWSSLIKERLQQIPASTEDLVRSYRRNKEDLGWLAHPMHRHAWAFFLDWLKNPNEVGHIPKMQPNGQIT